MTLPASVMAQALDVTLPTSTTGWTAVAGTLGVVAAATTTTWVALVGWGDHAAGHAGSPDAPFDRPQAWAVAARRTAIATTLGAIGARSIDLVLTDAVATAWSAFGHRTVVAGLVRVTLLAAAALVTAVVATRPGALTRAEARRVRGMLAVLAVATVVVTGARTASGRAWLDVLLVLAATALAGGVAMALWRRRPDLRRAGAAILVPVAAAAAPAWPLVAPPSDVPMAGVVVRDGSARVDVSVVPAAPGSAAVHVYAFDGEHPVEVVGGTVGVVGASTAEMFQAGPNHLIAYGVELPDMALWELSVRTRRPDGSTMTTVARLERP